MRQGVVLSLETCAVVLAAGKKNLFVCILFPSRYNICHRLKTGTYRRKSHKDKGTPTGNMYNAPTGNVDNTQQREERDYLK